ncbi:MFS transporter [Campylobacter sp. MIT 99-7217]|uniref:MFS transporter n=1 Tax=Campylobacter sp. MIT 99-7217 TaxID=535091 RepID=UPI00115AA877|nr:MFS transporter [Campylobacter sp. MIT 99-7217]TQR32970.1 MFS transporter [Campylobacter sp. MIT 99-7217]
MNHLKLLKNNKNILILSSVQFIVYFGAWFSQTGVYTLLIDLNAPIWAIATSATLAFLPGIILAPLNGVIVERNSPKKLLLSMACVELISIFLLIFVTNLSMLWLLFILIFSRLCVASIYFQAEMSLLAKILNAQDLKLANEIHSIIWAFSYTIGMASAGVFINFFGTKYAFLFDCCLIFIGIIMLLNLKLGHFHIIGNGSLLKMIKEGLFYVYRDKNILHLIFLHAFVGLTAYESLVALLAKHEYKEILSTALVIGFLNAVRACSLIVGPIVLSKIVGEKQLFYVYLGQGFGIIAWALTQFNFYFSFLGLLAAGFCTSTLWSFTYTMIQKNCDKAFYGRVIAYTDMAYLCLSAFVSIMIGMLFDFGLSLKLITALLGGIFIFAGFYWAFFLKKIYT